MSRLQIWELSFRLPYMRLDEARTFNILGYKLSLNQIDGNHSEGCLHFEIENDFVDKDKAGTFGRDWIQKNLVDSYLMAFGRHLKPEFDEPTLLNESELPSVPKCGSANVPVSFTVVVPLPVANVERSLDLIMKADRSVNKELLERSLLWFRKAKESVDIVDRFLMQWIAFNGLYGMFDPDKKGDKIAIKNLINKHPSREKIGEILAAHDQTIKNLGSRELRDYHEQKNYSDELKNLIGNRDIRRVLMAVGLCLWVVRSEIFHGGTMPSQEVDFIRGCSQLLERIYRECFSSYVGFA